MKLSQLSQSLKQLRLIVLTAMLGVSLCVSQAALAEPAQPFSDPAFKAAQTAGKTVLLEVHADWCPACKNQAAALESLCRQPVYARIVRLRIDFDHPGTALKTLEVQHQATLVLYEGSKEIARSSLEQDQQRIRALLDRAG